MLLVAVFHVFSSARSCPRHGNGAESYDVDRFVALCFWQPLRAGYAHVQPCPERASFVVLKGTEPCR